MVGPPRLDIDGAAAISSSIHKQYEFGAPSQKHMRILVFTEGTILNSSRGWVLIGNAANKLRTWQERGATISYLSSKRDRESLDRVRKALKDGGAPDGELFFRQGSEHYGQAAERSHPDVIVEDDCKSIGGAVEMTYPKLSPESRTRTSSVVVAEGGGIDHLPNDPAELIGRI